MTQQGNVFTPEDCAATSPTESEMRSKVFDEAANFRDNHVADATSAGVRVPATKAWLACRKFLEQGGKNDNVEECLLNQVEKPTGTRWRARHNFEFICDVILILQTQKKIYGITLRPSSTLAAGWDILQRRTTRARRTSIFLDGRLFVEFNELDLLPGFLTRK